MWLGADGNGLLRSLWCFLVTLNAAIFWSDVGWLEHVHLFFVSEKNPLILCFNINFLIFMFCFTKIKNCFDKFKFIYS